MRQDKFWSYRFPRRIYFLKIISEKIFLNEIWQRFSIFAQIGNCRRQSDLRMPDPDASFINDRAEEIHFTE